MLPGGQEGSDLPTPTESLAGRGPWARCTSAGLGVLRKHGGAERKPRESWRQSLRDHTVLLGISFPQGGDSLSSLGSFAAVHVGNVGEPALNSHVQDHPRHGAWEPRGTCASTSATCPPCSSGKDVLPPRKAPVCSPEGPAGSEVGSRGWAEEAKTRSSLQLLTTCYKLLQRLAPLPGARGSRATAGWARAYRYVHTHRNTHVHDDFPRLSALHPPDPAARGQAQVRHDAAAGLGRAGSRAGRAWGAVGSRRAGAEVRAVRQALFSPPSSLRGKK